MSAALPAGVHCVTGAQPGPTVAVFAGVHGNEKAGVYAFEQLLPELTITRGKAYFVFANPEAIKADVRMVGKNLNRCFYMGNDGDAPEDKRARELMNILDECDALLDLHMFYDDGEPFAICETEALELAAIFDVGIVSTGWNALEPGAADGYMYETGKLGVCLECGPLGQSRAYTAFARNAIFQFLAYFSMTAQPVAFSKLPKSVVTAVGAVHKTVENFVLEPGFRNFQLLATGQRIAHDDTRTYVAGKSECIIFPHYKARVGEEAYIIGRLLAEH